jgi:hypothetical protein
VRSADTFPKFRHDSRMSDHGGNSGIELKAATSAYDPGCNGHWQFCSWHSNANTAATTSGQALTLMISVESYNALV